MEEKLEKGQILHVQFNQDSSCFSIGTTKGFVVFNSDPLKERFRRNFGRGLGFVEMLFKCNILAFIGGGSEPLYPRNKVMLWDDYKTRCFAELEFRHEVLSVRLRRDKIAVVVQKTVYVYKFADLSLLNKHDTYNNPRGLCALSADPSRTVLACPGTSAGQVRVDLFDIGKSHVIAAHSGELTQLVLNLEGSLLATASDKGTLIRVWDTVTGVKVGEFRRGTSSATIYSIAFSRNSSYIIVGSDKGTVHLYALYQQPNQGQQQTIQQQSQLPVPLPGGAQIQPVSVDNTTNSAGGGSNSNNFVNNNFNSSNNMMSTGDEDLDDDGTVSGGGGGSSSSSTPGGPLSVANSSVRNKHSRLSFFKDVLPGYFSSEWSFASFTVDIVDPTKKFYAAFGADETTILVVCEDGTYHKYLLRPEQARIIQIGDATFH